MLDHRGAHRGTWHQDTLGHRSITDLEIVSSDLWLGTEVLSWIRWREKMLDRCTQMCSGRANISVHDIFICCNRILREAEDVEWTMRLTSEAAARSCSCNKVQGEGSRLTGLG